MATIATKTKVLAQQLAETQSKSALNNVNLTEVYILKAQINVTLLVN
jgi:hypothetical protein